MPVTRHPSHFTFFAEPRLNQLGYVLLRQTKIAEAIVIFKANVELYPKSSNVYDSLAEAYMANGNKDLARLNFKKSLELDPQNRNAIDMLKKLGPQREANRGGTFRTC